MLLSIVIPVKNGAATLENCLRKIRSQTIKDIEILILDSNSNDESKTIGFKYGAKIIDISPHSFNHGLTRNIGVENASSSLIYFTVQDAWIPDVNMLEKMINHFEKSDVMAVVGHQAIEPGNLDMNPAFWFKRFSEPEVETRFFPLENSFTALNKDSQFQLSSWDNVNAMYRKQALLNIPFKETNFSEDWLWANEALISGFKILRDPGLVIYHYHHMLFPYTFKTNFTINYHFLYFFNHHPKMPWSPFGLFQSFRTISKKKGLSFYKKIFWMCHNFFFRIAIFLSVFVFKVSFSFGGLPFIKKMYKIVCKQIPQGEQSFKNPTI